MHLDSVNFQATGLRLSSTEDPAVPLERDGLREVKEPALCHKSQGSGGEISLQKLSLGTTQSHWFWWKLCLGTGSLRKVTEYLLGARPSQWGGKKLKICL